MNALSELKKIEAKLDAAVEKVYLLKAQGFSRFGFHLAILDIKESLAIAEGLERDYGQVDDGE